MNKKYTLKQKFTMAIVSSLIMSILIIIIAVSLGKNYKSREFDSTLKYISKDSSVKLSSYSVDDGKLYLKFNFKNKSDSPKAFLWTYDVKCFQNGKEITEILLSQDEEFNNCGKEIDSGRNITCENIYSLKGKSDVDIVLYKCMSKKELARITISLNG